MTSKQETIYSREYSTTELIDKIRRGEDTASYYAKVRADLSATSEQLNENAHAEARQTKSG
jgi:hypothetical protein